MIMTLPVPAHDDPPLAPRVAVIVPAYGVAHLVGEALDSLQRQTLQAWECVVIDDGAPDDVASAVAPYLSDRRIRFIATANGGVSTARNRAVAESTAPLLALLDGDDLFRPRYLETMVGILEADPQIRLATCNARMFGAVDRERTCVDKRQGTTDGIRGSLADVLDRSFNVYIGTTFRRSDFDAVGGFDTTMAQSEDFDLWVRLMMLGGHAHYVDEVLGDYRVRPGSASSNAGRMLCGNIKVYTKTLDHLPPDRPEHQLVQRLLAESRASLSFEHAMDRIIDGDSRRGLADLREAVRAGGMVSGPVWRLAFSLWQVLPWLARPMLRWRRRAHSRGAAGASGSFPAFLEIEG
jgi:glycosyltransferase involved in cell wall biosynthesis